MEFTGERMIPEKNEGQGMYLEHLARYNFVLQFVKNKVVLDIACGSGYGSELLAKSGATKVFGVDIDMEAIEYCREKYQSDNIEFLLGNVTDIPLDDKSVDLIVSFETIEHVTDKEQKLFLSEVKRVLKSDGLFIVSTPNLLVHPKGNKYHLKELLPDEFEEILRENFLSVNIFYQDASTSSFIFPQRKTFPLKVMRLGEGTTSLQKIDLSRALNYLIGLCSNGDGVKINNTEGSLVIYKNPDQIIYKKNNEIERVSQVIKEKDKELERAKDLVMEKEGEISLMQASKFWKLRGLYLKAKFLFLSPDKFLRKYLPKMGYLYKISIFHLKNEGPRKVIVRSLNYLKYGKGVLDTRLLPQDSNINVHIDERPRKTYEDGKWPSFSIVSVLYNKENEVIFFLKSFLQQQYEGKFEVILVDDFSGDSSVRKVEEFLKDEGLENNDHIKIRIIRNDNNKGNCKSRNKGISEARGDILIVIDADCVVNKDFLKNHAEAYFYGDCDVAIGPLNLETNGAEPFSVLDHYEKKMGAVDREAIFQDKINKRSFLNCITRNFSIRKGFLENDLFDDSFSYSINPDSGFGWEDVEMGYRLYKRGARIKYVRKAFSIHVTHSPSIDPKIIPSKSLKNFRKLFKKHPELLYVSRRWSLETYEKIKKWFIDLNGEILNEDLDFFDNSFQKFLPNPFFIKPGKRLKILSYRWHCSHQYEIYKLPHDFTLVRGLGTGMSETWDYERRPLPENVQMRHISEVDTKDYDLAILHFDENVLAWENTNGIIGPDWGACFRWFCDKIKIPKVAVCHGTPQFYGQYNGSCKGHRPMEVIEEERKKMVEALKNTLVIVNSYQAQREWRFKRSKVIWHGFDPSEFPPGTYERGILMMNENSMKHRPHYNGYVLKNEIFEQMPKEFQYHNQHTSEPSSFYWKNTNEYAYAKFDNYVRELGKYSIYLNTTLRSPMPRTRSEAMMCGVVVVTTKSHDAELFIKNGVNGFCSNDPDELREYLLFLLNNPVAARKIGLAGRMTAMDIFNHDRFLKNWNDTINELIDNRFF